MDLTPFKLDIDELLDEFFEEKCTTLADSNYCQIIEQACTDCISQGAELELKTLKKMSTEYAKAKELAMKEDVLHINENEKTACDTAESIVEQWEAQKDDFYKQTGISRHNETVPAVDAFNEIEQLLEE